MKTPIKHVLALSLMTVLVAGCETTGGYQTQSSDPYGQQPPPQQQQDGMNRAQRGALIGAAAGIVAGLISGDSATERRQHALIGAGVGALAGGSIGHYQDKQEAALRQRMAGTGVDVVRQGDNITLDMPSAITFGFDSTALRPEATSVLAKVAQTLAEYNQTIVEVAGHTDSVGSEAYNQKLSEQRAQSVGNFLAARGVDSRRMIMTGAGEMYPVASNETEAGRAENRRVEITLVPIREN